MKESRVCMGASGRVVIPASIRKALGINTGDELILQADENELRLTTLKHRIARAQRNISRYIKPGVRLSDELIAERREAAKRE